MAASQSMNSAAAKKPVLQSFLSVLSSGAGTVFLLYLILYIIYAALEPRALSSYTFTNLVNNSVPLALAAAGETLVVLSRGFDLSVAGVVSLTNVLMAVYPQQGPGGALISIVGCLFIGGLVGAANGLLVVVLKLQPIAATLATMIICQGISLVILDAPGGLIADWLSYELTDRLFGIVPISGLIVLAVVLIWMAFKRTNTGIGIYAIGADEQAAALSGIPVDRVRFTAFLGAGMLYGLAGYMLSAQTATGDPNAGTPFLMLTFAAVALGGTSLAGGRGGLVGSVMGAATLMLLQKVLFSAGVSSFYTGVFQGIILVLAIIFGGTVSKITGARAAR